MKVVNSSEIKELDSKTIKIIGIPGIILMENAANKVFRVIESKIENLSSKNAIILCGSGNNGGDGFAVARLLFLKGVNVNCIIFKLPEDLKGDAKVNFEICKNLGLRIINFNDLNKSEKFDFVVDAIFGTGIKGIVKEPYSNAIEWINSLKGRNDVKIFSIDIPSGVDSDTGNVLNIAVKSDYTVTMQLPKIGNVVYPGAEFNGELYVAKIGITEDIKRELEINLLMREEIVKIIPRRNSLNTHKGNFGHILIIGGSTGMAGAPLMAAKAALRAGAGLVTLCVPENLIPVVESMSLEIMSYPLPQTSEGTFSISANKPLIKIIREKKVNAVVIGPGISTHRETMEFVIRAINDIDLPLVIDADGLKALPSNFDVLKNKEFVLTPHPGEMSFLLDVDKSIIQSDRIKHAYEISKRVGGVVVLKGAGSIIACRNEISICPIGCPALSTAGSGDVLTGIISAFIGQGLSIKDSAKAGVYVHGLCGDLLNENRNFGWIATDIIDAIPEVMDRLIKGKIKEKIKTI